MNTFEFLVQNLARKSEAQSQKAGIVSAGSTDGSVGADGGPSFNTLLNALSAKGEEADMLLQSNSVATGVNGSRADQKEPMEKRLALSKDSTSMEVSLPSGVGENVEILAQGIFPLLVQSQQQASTMHAALPPASYGSSSQAQVAKSENDGARGVQNAEGILSLKVKVLHQEAHFKPVLTNALPQGSDGGADGLSTGGQFASLITQPEEGADMVSQNNPDTMQALSSTKASSSVVMASGVDLGPTGEPIFQQLASAIAKEAAGSPPQQAQEITEISHPSANIVLKPSENVLRVLSIQLHPLELGVVTVKMRLSGDQLEMELHAHNEETADLLRKDAEKLSGLLRTTGYRADIVTVHTMRTEILQQENSARQNDSWTSQPQSGGSQQGQAGQQGSARQSSADMDELKHRVRGYAESERSAESHSGGIYL